MCSSDLDYWLSKKEEEAREKEEALAQAGARPKSSPEPARGPNPASKLSPNEIYRRKQRLAQLEQDIAATEKRQSEVNQEIMAQASDHQKLHALSTELQLLHNELEKYYGEWESLTHELEENS